MSPPDFASTNLMETCMRLEGAIFPNGVIYMSSHWRHHILQDIKNVGGLIYVDRFCEKGHQRIIKIKRNLKRMKSGDAKLATFPQQCSLEGSKLELPGRIKQKPTKAKPAKMTPVVSSPQRVAAINTHVTELKKRMKMTWSAGKPKPKTKKRPLPIFDLELGTDQDARPPKKNTRKPLWKPNPASSHINSRRTSRRRRK